MQAKRIIIVNDCSDANARLRIEAQVAMAFPNLPITFYASEPFATLSLSFLLAEAEFTDGDVVLFNAAPRNATQKVEGNRAGEMVFVKVKTGGLLVGPNEGNSLTLIKDQIETIYTKRADDGNVSGTQFRSAYVFPKAAGEFVALPEERREEFYTSHTASTYPIPTLAADHIAWIDSFDNIKLTRRSTQEPALQPGHEYIVRFKRDGLLVKEIKLPYREKLTLLDSGELGIITGSSFGQTGLEIARRTGVVKLPGAVAHIHEQFGFTPYVEDEIQIS